MNPNKSDKSRLVNAAPGRRKAIQADRPRLNDPRQTDFWPELNSPTMAFYAGAASRMSARSVSEDSQPRTAAGAPLGIYGENAVTLSKRGERE